MAEDIAISVRGVSKNFKLPLEKHAGLKQTLINFRPGGKHFKIQHALRDITFDIHRGEFFGIVGRNGSGKSTLLKMLAGIYPPVDGTIEINGSLTPFIELGVGFNPELTGRENVYLNGALLGFDHKQMDAMYDDIVGFAELPAFMDQKLKNYSSGMQVRLAFSIAIRSDSDILLIDEVLAVGDAVFQEKCYEYFQEIKHSDKTVIFVSHDLSAVENFCDRALLIGDGEQLFLGKSKDATALYRQSLMSGAESITKEYVNEVDTHGVKILGAEIINSHGESTKEIKESEPFTVRLRFNAQAKIENPVIGIAIVDPSNRSVIGPNTLEAGVKIAAINGNGVVEAEFADNPISPGKYHIVAGIFDSTGKNPYAFSGSLLMFTIKGKSKDVAINLQPRWTIKGKA